MTDEERMARIWQELNGEFDLNNTDGRFLYEKFEQREAAHNDYLIVRDNALHLAGQNYDLKQRNALMLSALEQISAWAQNDINMRKRNGQWVGTPKFADLRTAVEVQRMVQSLTASV